MKKIIYLSAVLFFFNACKKNEQTGNINNNSETTLSKFKKENSFFTKEQADKRILEGLLGSTVQNALVPLVFKKNGDLYTDVEFNESIKNHSLNENTATTFFTDIVTYNKLITDKFANKEYVLPLGVHPKNNDRYIYGYDPYTSIKETYSQIDNNIKELIRNSKKNIVNTEAYSKVFKKSDVIYQTCNDFTILKCTPISYLGHTAIVTSPASNSVADRCSEYNRTWTIHANYASSGVVNMRLSTNCTDLFMDPKIGGRLRCRLVSNITDAQQTAVTNYLAAQVGEPYDFTFTTNKYTEYWWYCSKLSWNAYYRTMNIDIDYNQGYWVLPYDIPQSNLLWKVGWN